MFHDSVHPRTAAHTVEILQELSFEILECPPYSSYIALSDLHLFGPLKNALKGCSASNHE